MNAQIRRTAPMITIHHTAHCFEQMSVYDAFLDGYISFEEMKERLK